MVLPLEVRTCVLVPVRKCLGPVTMLEAVVPAPLILITIRENMQSEAMGLRLVPLTKVRIILDTLPDSVAVLEPQVPLSVVNLSIGPRVDSLPVGFALLEDPEVGIAVGVPFEAPTLPEVLDPRSLVLAPIAVLHDPLAVPGALLDLPNKHSILESLFGVILQGFEVVEGEF